jgi:hypothetical protein
MGFSVLPTNIGGFSLGGAAGPLASLLTPTQQVNNLFYPSDLGSNPAMGHAVIISAFDYTTGLGNELLSGVTTTVAGIQNLAANPSFTNLLETSLSAIKGAGGVALTATQAPNYQPIKATSPLATVSLFMPENLNVSYNSSYQTVSITEELGIGSYAGNAYADQQKGQLKNTVTSYAAAANAAALNAAASLLPGSSRSGNIGALALQGAGIFTNPQIQLLYQGTAPREFTLEFLMTPKSSAEAKTIQNICDTMAFYSLPGVAGGQSGQPGQFLTPPQVFTIQFKFLGQNNITGTLSNVLTSALNSSGLGFLTQLESPTGAIQNAPAAKVMTVNDCFLSDVNIDYAPNGWAAYNDGYPVQTKLTLVFKETTMVTKSDKQFAGGSVSNNFEFSNPGIQSEVEKLGGTRNDFLTGSNGFGNYGE